jgi:hypothetical protein
MYGAVQAWCNTGGPGSPGCRRVSQFGAVHVGNRVGDGRPVLLAGLEGLLDLDAALAPGAAGREPVHDIAWVVTVEGIAPRGDINRDPRTGRGMFDSVLDLLFQSVGCDAAD